MIAAILRAQWLSMRFRLGSSRRGAIFSLFTALFWYGVWTVLAVMAEQFASSASFADAIRVGLPTGFALVFAYWQFAPIISASLGASLDLKKLLVYPVPHRKLFVIEVLLRLTTCAEMMLVMTGALIGLWRNPVFGGLAALPRLALAFVAFALFNLLLSSGLRNLLERLLTHKRLREVLVLLLAIAATLPRLPFLARSPKGSMGHLPADALWGLWPWTATAHLALHQALVGPVLVLIWWTAAAFAFGRWQFERSLHYDAQATAPHAPRGGRTRSRLDAFYRLPAVFLPDPLAAMVEKELRALSRTPRFRMVFIMGFSFGLLIWLPVTLRGGGGSTVVSDHYLTIVSVYALLLLGQVSYLNTFGFDRSAVQVYFSAPVSMARSLAAKNMAVALFIVVEMVAVTLAATVMRLRVVGGNIPEAFLVTAIVGVYLLAIGNLSSVHFPRAMNPERVSQGGAASRMQALIFLFYPVALLPVFLAFWARYVFDSQLIFFLILAFAAILGGVVYWIAMESAVQAALERRETILMELSRGEGPVAAE